MTSTNSKLLGNFLGEVLKKEYPHLNTNDWITLEVLLSWALWPSYLKIVQQGMIFMHFCSIQINKFSIFSVFHRKCSFTKGWDAR